MFGDIAFMHPVAFAQLDLCFLVPPFLYSAHDSWISVLLYSCEASFFLTPL